MRAKVMKLKIFLLFFTVISNISLSATLKKSHKVAKKIPKEVKESILFDFNNNKKIRLELSVDTISDFNHEKNVEMSAKNNIYISTKLFEFLKLSGGINFGQRSFKPLNYYAILGLDFKEYGNIEITLDSVKKADFKYEYDNKINDLDINIKAMYSLFSSERKVDQKEIEHYYGISTNVAYDLGYNFKLSTDLNTSLSTWFSGEKLIPYNFLLGVGIDYKKNIIAGAYVAHYNLRKAKLDRNDMLRTTTYNKGFSFKAYLGYEWEKSLSDSSKISLMGKLGTNIEKKIYTGNTLLKVNDIVKNTTDNDDYSFISLNPQLKLKYKFNDNFDIEMEYISNIEFNTKKYQKSSNTIRAGVKYIWGR